MAAITGIELKQRLEDYMAHFICKKDSYLAVGKSVAKINYRLQALYNWWVITDSCALTDAEINCIVDDIGTTCGYVPAVRDYTARKDIVRPEPIYKNLDAIMNCASNVGSDPETPDGQLIAKISANAGAGGYTYLWTVEIATTVPIQNRQDIGLLTLTNATTDTVTIDNIGYDKVFFVKCTVTDSNSNEISILKMYYDGYGQKEVCILASPQPPPPKH